MKIIKEVRQVGTGNVVANATATVQTWPEKTLVGSGTTDSEGLATITAQGSPGATRTIVDRGTTYEEYSDNVQPSSQFDLDHLRTRLANLVNDGVIPSYGDAFRVSTGSGTIILAAGGVVLDGIIALFPSSTTISVANGDRKIVARLVDDTVSLVESSSSINYAVGTTVPLYTYTVSSGQVVTSTVATTHRLAGPRRGSKAVFGIASASSGSTLSAGGEDAGISLTLDLESGVTYDIQTKASVVGSGYDGAIAIAFDGAPGPYRSLNGDTAGRVTNSYNYGGATSGSPAVISIYDRRDTTATSIQWALQATYGPTFNSLAMSNPDQVAVDGTGRILIADTGNDRLVILTSAGAYSAGITGLTGITGVCVDASDNIYTWSMPTSTTGRVRKYNSSLVQQWSVDPGVVGLNATRHIATDGTYLYLVNAISNTIFKRLCSTGALVTSYGSTGSGNGQFSTPWGITYSTINTVLYVADSGNNRVQLLTTSGAFVTAITGFSAPRGVISSQPQEVLVADYGNDAVKRVTDIMGANTVTTLFSQTDPSGVAVATGDVIWTNNTTTGAIAKWDEAVSNTPFSWTAGLLVAMAIPRG